MKRAKKMSKDYKGQRTQSAELKKVNKEYAKAKTHEQKIIALQNKRKVLNKSIKNLPYLRLQPKALLPVPSFVDEF